MSTRESDIFDTLSTRNLIASLLVRLSSTGLNRVDNYGARYFVDNYLRHANAWYGFIVKFYYFCLAYHCMIRPTNMPPGSRVLDIGCGIGFLAEQFHKLGYQVVGMDVHQAALALSIYPEGCCLVNTTAQLDYPDGYFDLVVSREVLEHIPASDIDNCIKEWDRVGKGVMVHIIAVTERGERMTLDPTHVNVQPEQWWVAKFEHHGYQVTRKSTRRLFSPFDTSGYLVLKRNSLTC